MCFAWQQLGAMVFEGDLGRDFLRAGIRKAAGSGGLPLIVELELALVGEIALPFFDVLLQLTYHSLLAVDVLLQLIKIGLQLSRLAFFRFLFLLKRHDLPVGEMDLVADIVCLFYMVQKDLDCKAYRTATEDEEPPNAHGIPLCL